MAEDKTNFPTPALSGSGTVDSKKNPLSQVRLAPDKYYITILKFLLSYFLLQSIGETLLAMRKSLHFLKWLLPNHPPLFADKGEG